MISQLFKIFFCLLLMVVNGLLSAYPGEVIGVFDSITETENHGALLKGWACQRNHSQSTEVYFFIGGPVFQGGTFIKKGIANLPNGLAVSNSENCNSPNYLYHRFSINLTPAEVFKYKGKLLYVHGKSTTGTEHLALAESGKKRLPVTEDPNPPVGGREVIGVLDSITETTNHSVVMKGWACQKDISESIAVSFLVEGALNQGGTLIKKAYTNKPNESVISGPNLCNSPSYSYHRFAISLTHEEVFQYKNKAIYVHGMSQTDSNHLPLGNSGHKVLPDVEDPNPPVAGREVIGVLDSISETSNHGAIMKGWACQKDISESIAVSFLVGGSLNQGGTLIKKALTNQPNESVISSNSLCNSPNYSYHRFAITLTPEETFQYKQKAIYVHGMSHTNSDHLSLGNSGNKFLPNVEDPSDRKKKIIKLSSYLVNSNSDILHVLSGDRVLIDQSLDTGFVKIEGELLCPEEGAFTLKTLGILVSGNGALFKCGSDNTPFTGKLQIILKGQSDLSDIADSNTHDLGIKGIVAMNNGAIEFIGQDINKGWVKLDGDAKIGDHKILLERPISWKVGEEIVVGPTGFGPREAELFKITEISNDFKTISLSSSFKYFHWGKLEKYKALNNQEWNLDQRAEVVNLSRNIVISSVNDNFTRENRVGAHMMVMGTGSAKVNSVEFIRMGQMAKMGRYPMHWHKKGNISGQYIKNSSIHDSFNRCVTLHGTQNGLVERNTCYNHFGHGFFLEDGNETNNKIIGNIGIQTKRVEKSQSLLISDVVSTDVTRFAAPSTFWISNPNNDISFNIASGSDGSGFWMAFQDSLFCDSSGCTKVPRNQGNTFPITEDTLNFSDNVAHSAAVGITHDGAPDGEILLNPNNGNDRALVSAHYRPANFPVFKNLVAYKNSLTGIYYRGEPAIYDNAILADNGSAFFVAYNQMLRNSLVVGISANDSNHEMNYHHSSNTPVNRKWPGPFVGVWIYDGPFALENVHFANFPSTRKYFAGKEITPVPFKARGGNGRFINTVKGLSFSPVSPVVKVIFPDDWINSWGGGIFDHDGSLNGNAGTQLRSFNEINNDTNCEENDEKSGLVCKYRVGQFKLISESRVGFLEYSVQRFDGSYYTDITRPQHNKVPLILNKGYRYDLDSVDLKEDPIFQLHFTAFKGGELSPIIHLKNVYRNCYLPGLSIFDSYADFVASNETSYYKNGTDFYFKLKTDRLRRVLSSLSPAGEKVAQMKCL